ncbi:heme peroxidase [Glutinoglossum americanum]|uniref:Peroxidase n=1 Tax=Glutinoglossum americanum TaxID=1670608 RepID=A0A9P8HXF1_9PEZI|nr:heme peroxidase [Glutinoglossum americanum]
MASTAGIFTRVAFRSAPAASIRTTARHSRFILQRQQYQAFRRGFASETAPKSSKTGAWVLLGLGAAGGAVYYAYSNGLLDTANELTAASGKKGGIFTPTKEDYQKVYNEIAKTIEEKDDYDDGSYGPVILRLAWHASGTYDKGTGTGGSNGATMRFAPESSHAANAGLVAARDFLEPIKQNNPWISYSDLWTLAGVCAVQEMQGPVVPWRPGRQDHDVSASTPDGRLPDASKEQSHLRTIFYRMGFDDREIVALSGAHALGRCHTDRSGYDGPWTFSPTVVTNDYYRLLLEEKWNWKKWNGPKQFEDKNTKTLMMLPTDMALVKDKAFRQHVERYAKDNDVWFNEFRDALVKLFELGVPFTTKEDERWTFTPTHA